MVVNWANTAINDLKEYELNSKIITDNNLKKYINSLILYTNSLEITPRLGKLLLENDDFEFRQLIYKMHKIFYYIYKDEIRILSVVHTRYDISNIIGYLYNLLDK